MGCRFAGLPLSLTFSVLTNSATTPLAVEATKALGLGHPPLTVAAAVASGVVGAMGGVLALDLFRVRGVIARGLPMGVWLEK